ncbi:hypothetical protein FYM84_14355 [Pseudomonas sp. CAH-1]|nr:hypothetical protein [Pseudomonas sp. CAH-1]
MVSPSSSPNTCTSSRKRTSISVIGPSLRCIPSRLHALPVGAGMPAKNPTRWLAPAAPVFAGMPAPTLGR